MGSGTGPKPLRVQRSVWRRGAPNRSTKLDEFCDMIGATPWHRWVHDGLLTAITAHEASGWHLSISHTANGPRQITRYPSWDEITDARYKLLPDDIWMAMYLPPTKNYVASHPTTFHLWEAPEPDGQGETDGR